ncbi:hypothetical protein TNCV_2242711 [Trichonephila clavipes]|nr:hypothetical protein TNCV_2242711 [Trichonephila clavipes]
MLLVQFVINTRGVIVFVFNVLIHENGVFAFRLSQSVISSMPTSSFYGIVPRSNRVGSRHVERLTTGRLPKHSVRSCQVIYSQFGLAIHQNDHQARRRFVEWAQNEIAVVPDFHKRVLFSDEAHFWFNKQNCRIWSEANPQVYGETPLHREN